MLKIATVIAILAVFSLGGVHDHGCGLSTSDQTASGKTSEGLA